MRPSFRRLPSRRTAVGIYIGLLVIVGVCMLSLKTCRGPMAPAPQKPSHGDTIRAAVVYGPMSYYLYGDTLGGMNFDLLRRFAASVNAPLELLPVISTEKSLNDLADGKIDIFASIPSDNNPDSRFLATQSLFLDRMVLVELNGKGKPKVESVLDLAGDTVHVEASSAAVTRLRNLSQEIGEPIHIAEHSDLSAEYLVIKVAKGEIRYAVVNEIIAKSMQHHYPQLSTDTPISFTQFQVWLVEGQNLPLIQSLNAWIEHFRTSDEYQKMLEKYKNAEVVKNP